MKDNFKKAIAAVIGAAMVLPGTFAFAQSGTDKVTVNMNGTQMNFDVDPVIENGRTLVPFRAIFENLGCAVSYQEIGGSLQMVEAQRGQDVILLQIGVTDMVVNGETVQLDVAPKIENGRTLVPLRAISESLGCNVKWQDDTKTVSIYKKLGQYDVRSGHIEKKIALDNGFGVAYISCAYPIILGENSSKFVEEINKSYRDMAEKYLADMEKENAEDAKTVCEQWGIESYSPMEFCLSFDVTANRKNLLSITTYDYRDSNGAHPNEVCESKTYDMKAEKTLALTDVFGTDQKDIDDMVYQTFVQYLKDESIEVDAETDKTVKEQAPNVNWYLTDDSVGMYFNPYDIAPYAAGRPSVALAYADAKDEIKVDLSEANLDKLEFELDGNPTTGYTWEIAKADADKIDVKSEYAADTTDKDIAGAGGKYKFTVTGTGEGNAEIECRYLRTFEGEKSALKTVILKLYVSKDKKITVLDKIESDNTKGTEAVSEKTTVKELSDDIAVLSDGQKYVLGEALVYDKDSKKITCTDLKAGDMVYTASCGDALVIIRNNGVSGEEAKNYLKIKSAEEDRIELDNGEVFLTGEASIYEAADSADYKKLAIGDEVIVAKGSGDTLVVIKY